MKKLLFNLFTPNRILEGRVVRIMIFIQVTFVLLLWSLSSMVIIPKPVDILIAMWDLIAHKELVRHFLISITLCFKAMGIAILVSLFVAYLSVLPFFRPFSSLVTKFRFLTTVGLSFLFLKLGGTTEGYKTILLTFSITVFFVTSVSGVMSSVTRDELNYARTLGMSDWRAFYEVMVLGKAHEVWGCVGQNFAISWMMLAMAENICKGDGGIGVLISDNNKHFNFEHVYAIQFLILLTGITLDHLIYKIKEFLFPYSIITLERR